MANIEIFIFVLLAILFLFDLYVLYKINDYGLNIYQVKLKIYQVKLKLDTIGYIQNKIIKTLEKDLQSDDLNNGAEADD